MRRRIIFPLIERIRLGLGDLHYEIIFIDDGSTDNTSVKIKQYASHDVKLIEFMKNYGQSCAMQAGIDFADGEYIATMDGDLQNDPYDIPKMLKLLIHENADLVAGERKNRQDGALIRKFPSRIANWIIRKTTQVTIKDYGCTLKVFKSKIAKKLKPLW